jgi:hypothetical protein
VAVHDRLELSAREHLARERLHVGPRRRARPRPSARSAGSENSRDSASRRSRASTYASVWSKLFIARSASSRNAANRSA